MASVIIGRFPGPRSPKKALISTLLLGSMYFWSWLIQLNRGYKYNENIACTGISTLNGNVSKTVIFFEKLRKIMSSKMKVASQHWTDWTVETIEINRKI